MTIERPMFPPPRRPFVDTIAALPIAAGAPARAAQTLEAELIELGSRFEPLLHLLGPERDTIAALLGFVACGLAYGSTLDQMEAIALAELERARKAAAKQQRYRWIIPLTAAEKVAKASSPAASAVRS